MIFHQSSMLFASLALISPMIQVCAIDTELETDIEVDVDDGGDVDVDVEIDVDVEVNVDQDGDGDNGGDGGDEYPPPADPYSLCVDDTYNPLKCFPTIPQALEAAKPGAVIKVFPGIYDEDVTIDKSVKLVGPHAGYCDPERDFGNETDAAIIERTVTITAQDVVLDGFSLTERTPSPMGDASGVVVTQGGSGAKILNNIIADFDATGTGEDAQGILLLGGPDYVTISCNGISGIRAREAAAGIRISAAAPANASTGIRIEKNLIASIESTNDGAYGILLDNPGSTFKVLDNEITGLDGSTFARGVAIEALTPAAPHAPVIEGNTFSDFTPATAASAAVYIVASNTNYDDIDVNWNQFNFGSTSPAVFGILVAFAPPAPQNPADLDGTCNWWGDDSGPNFDDGNPNTPTGTGARVSDGVLFTPWLITPTGPCEGGLPPTP